MRRMAQQTSLKAVGLFVCDRACSLQQASHQSTACFYRYVWQARSVCDEGQALKAKDSVKLRVDLIPAQGMMKSTE